MGFASRFAELDDRTLYRLALIDIGKAGFNPDEPRIPKGEPHAGEWTNGSSGDAGTDWSHDLSDNALLPDDPSSTGDISDETFSTNTMPVAFSFEGDPQAAGIAEQATVAGSNPLLIAYPGDYHDAVVQALKDYLIQNGGVVITGVMLNAINGATAVADMVVKLPGAPPFIVEVKTGPGAQFTYSQMSVYPMAQIGGHVSSPNASLGDVGLTPGELLPPLDVYVYWVVNPGERGRLVPLPRPEFAPD